MREHVQHQENPSTASISVGVEEPKLGGVEVDAAESGRAGFDFRGIPIHRGSVQAKAIVSEPGDAYELEADCIADQVLSMPEPSVETMASKSVGGQGLDAKTRASMESRFGYDFSRIRVHADAAAAKSARSLGAQAYTMGPNIVFGASQFAPETASGRRLLAHELAHVVQQRAAPASSGAAVATSHASGIVQRQPVAATRTPADNIKDAIALLRKVQPMFIAQSLSAVPLNSGSAQVHSVQHAKAGKPVTSVFTLELKLAPLTGFTVAEFQGPVNPRVSAGTQTFAMTITISDRAATLPPAAVARDLFHEGMHMQLYIDRAVPSWSSTLYLKGYQDYLATARKSDNFTPLITQLTAFLKSNVKGKAQAVAAREAKEIVERIIEEKYVMDTTEQGIDGRRQQDAPNPPTGRRAQYLRLTTRWLVTYVDQVGVTSHPPDELTSMAGKLVTLWSDIDAKAPPPPRYPVPMGMQLTPDILPLPLPAAP